MGTKKFMEEISEELKEAKKELVELPEEAKIKEKVEEKPKRLSCIEKARNVQQLK